MSQHCIVIPVYNDWQSAVVLLERIGRVVASWKREVTVLLVNDGSTAAMPDLSAAAEAGGGISHVIVLDLVCNQGHQRAIAVGLCQAHTMDRFESVFVMDGDGEDPPEELDDLFKAGNTKGDTLVTAKRVSRSEGPLFKMCYACYKLLFLLLTGTDIQFGNFSLISKRLLAKLVHYPELWNSYAGCLKKSRLPIRSIPSHRGKRFSGESKMNFVSLVTHGLSTISVYQDVVLVRLALAMGAGVGFSAALCIAILAGCGPGGSHAWPMVVGPSLLSGFLLAFLVVLLFILNLLHQRAVQHDGPKAFWEAYVRRVHVIKQPKQ